MKLIEQTLSLESGMEKRIFGKVYNLIAGVLDDAQNIVYCVTTWQ